MGSTAHFETAEFSDDELLVTLLPTPLTLAAVKDDTSWFICATVQDNFLSFLYCIYH
jgi:hypothetical protein